MKTFFGTSKCEGGLIGNICVIESNKDLVNMIGRNLKYKLQVWEEDEKRENATFHKVKYIKFNPTTRQHLFEITTCEDKQHIVDISTGCGCQFASSKGIAKGKLCSHIIAAMEKMIR